MQDTQLNSSEFALRCNLCFSKKLRLTWKRDSSGGMYVPLLMHSVTHLLVKTGSFALVPHFNAQLRAVPSLSCNQHVYNEIGSSTTGAGQKPAPTR